MADYVSHVFHLSFKIFKDLLNFRTVGGIVFSSSAFICCVFYILWRKWIFFFEKPRVVCQSTHLNQELVDSCASLRGYRSTIWGHNKHFQTFYNSVIRREKMPPFDRERLSSPDGGIIVLDWICGEQCDRDYTPIVIVVPGICNSIDSHYIRSFSNDAVKKGYRVVVVASRGVVELTTPKIFTMGGTEDLRHAVEHIRIKHPKSPLLAVGFSLGGNILCKYLGENAANGHPQHDLIGAICISQGYDGARGIKLLKKNWVYDLGVSKKLTRLLRRHSHLFKDSPYDVDHIAKNVSSVEDFDKLFTCKFFGYEDTRSYYDAQSSIHHIPHINLPLLLVNALDDPIVDPTLVPFHLPQDNHNLILVTTEKGGHLAWCEGLFRPNGHWHERLALEFVEALLANVSRKKESKQGCTNESMAMPNIVI